MMGKFTRRDAKKIDSLTYLLYKLEASRVRYAHYYWHMHRDSTYTLVEVDRL